MFGCVCCGYLCVLRSRWCLPRVKAIALSKLEQYDMVAEEEEETFRGAVQSQLSMGSEGSGKHKRFDDELYRLTRERARTMTVESLQPSSVKMQGMMIETHPQEAGHDDVTSEDSVQHKPPSQEQEESFPPRQHMESTGLSSEGSTEFIGKMLISEPGLQGSEEMSSDERSDRNIGGDVGMVEWEETWSVSDVGTEVEREVQTTMAETTSQESSSKGEQRGKIVAPKNLRDRARELLHKQEDLEEASHREPEQISAAGSSQRSHVHNELPEEIRSLHEIDVEDDQMSASELRSRYNKLHPQANFHSDRRLGDDEVFDGEAYGDMSQSTGLLPGSLRHQAGTFTMTFDLGSIKEHVKAAGNTILSVPPLPPNEESHQSKRSERKAASGREEASQTGAQGFALLRNSLSILREDLTGK